MPRQGRRLLARMTLSPQAGFAAVAYAFGVTMLSTTLPTPLYPLYQRQLGFSELTVTVVFAAYAAGVLAALVLFGNASDAVGRRRVLLSGLGAATVSAVVFLTEADLAMLFVGRVLSGLAAGLFTGTATATLLDLAPGGKRGRGSLVATLVNMGGLGLGPLLAGLLAQYVGAPLRVTYVIDLVLLVPAVLGVFATPETVRDTTPLRRPSLRVPREVQGIFAQAAMIGFAGFVVLGTFTAVSPAALGQLLHEHNLALVGVVVFAVFGASAAGQLALAAFSTRAALPCGAAALTVGALLIALALWQESLPVLVAGGMVAGLGQGLGFRAGLAAVNAATPADRRAGATSVFFAVLYVGISLPVVGIGLAAASQGLKTAAVGAALAVAGLEVIAGISLVLRPVSEQYAEQPPAVRQKEQVRR